ncbi:MAG: hypothetical protein BWY81_00060 [Firmicutes bacterium ADurb.Bin467]|nr:MAG: hypothetical protein BWY81_00060 [Firmicutes bacterium ADurb.Bin467]
MKTNFFPAPVPVLFISQSASMTLSSASKFAPLSSVSSPVPRFRLTPVPRPTWAMPLSPGTNAKSFSVVLTSVAPTISVTRAIWPSEST